MTIADIFRKLKERKRMKEDFAREQNVVENFEEKKLSSDERELDKWREQARQKKIKEIVRKLRKKENDEVWSGRKSNPAAAPNIVANHKELFKNHNNMFSHMPNGYHHKNITKGHQCVYKCDNMFGNNRFGGRR